MSAEPRAAVSVRGLSKVFEIPIDRRNRLKEHVVNLFRSPGRRRLEALHDIELTVDRGEFFSIIGPNGSGKSTLLKILAGIYQPTRGTVSIAGRLSPFIELGVGFNFDLTARDNVYLSGTILGLSRSQITELLDEIIAFAELEDFVDQKLKNYSSGMLVRLAFSIAIRAHAEVLLIDEVLAVGDASFQQKCFEVFRRIKAEGRTIIFVSHDLATVKEFSDRVMVLDRGRNRGVFSAPAAIAEYYELNEERARRELAGKGDLALADDAEAVPSDRPRVASVDMLVNGKSTRVVHRGDDVTVLLNVENPQRSTINTGVAIYRSDGLYCFGTNSFIADARQPSDPEVAIEVTFKDLPLHRGQYYLIVGLYGESPRIVYEMHDHINDFQVAQWDDYEGVMYINHRWDSGQEARQSVARKSPGGTGRSSIPGHPARRRTASGTN